MNYSSLLKELQADLSLLQKEVMDAVRLDQNAMLMDMVRMSSLHGKWAFLSSLAEAEVKKHKRIVEEEILPLCRTEAEQLCKEQNRKVLKQTLDDIAKEDPGYKSAMEELDTLHLLASILKNAAVAALLTKRDMLQSLNSRQKVELGALPHDHTAFNFDDLNSRQETPDYFDSTMKTTKQERPTEQELETLLEDFATDLRTQWRKENTK